MCKKNETEMKAKQKQRNPSTHKVMGQALRPCIQMLENPKTCKQTMETYKNMLGHKLASKDRLEKTKTNTIKQKLYLLLVEMGHHALAWRSASLDNGGAMAQ